MEIIKTKTLHINNVKRVAFIFEYNRKIINLIKTIDGRKWSATKKFWHIPFKENYPKILNNHFKGKLRFIENKKESKFPPEYLETLKLKNYSQATIKTYKLHFQRFLKHFPGTELKDITKEQIRKYILYLVQEKNYSSSAQNQAVSAIKFYFEKILGRETKKYYFEMPRNEERKLPVVLSKKEVKLFFSKIDNKKTLAIFKTIYSSGLRLSELINLRISDLDSERMLINIRGGKGMKDRLTILSKDLLTILRSYFSKYKPKTWLFETSSNRQYSARAIQKMFHETFDRTGINKKATVHTLRHSFATHLLENGEDIRKIQRLLGHKNLKTTEIYTHITAKGLQRIKSPFDSLNIENGEN